MFVSESDEMGKKSRFFIKKQKNDIQLIPSSESGTNLRHSKSVF